MVAPLPVLHPHSGRSMAKQNPPLCSLQQTAETRNGRGLGPRLQSFPWNSAIDKGTKLAILSLLEALRELMKSKSEMRILSLRFHDALVKARVPSYLEAYESGFDHPLSELTSDEKKLAHLVDAGIQVTRNNFAR